MKQQKLSRKARIGQKEKSSGAAWMEDQQGDYKLVALPEVTENLPEVL